VRTPDGVAGGGHIHVVREVACGERIEINILELIGGHDAGKSAGAIGHAAGLLPAERGVKLVMRDGIAGDEGAGGAVGGVVGGLHVVIHTHEVARGGGIARRDAAGGTAIIVRPLKTGGGDAGEARIFGKEGIAAGEGAGRAVGR